MGGNVPSILMKSGIIVGTLGVILDGRLINAARTVAQNLTKGSIFGTPQAKKDLGYENAETNVQGITTAKSDGVTLIIAAIGVGGLIAYYVYTRLREKEGVIDQLVSKEDIEPSKIFYKYRDSQFKQVEITKRQYVDILSLTVDQYNQCLKGATCKITKQVMRQPTTMKCCKHLNKVGQWSIINFHLFSRNEKKRCILCKSPANQSFMELHQRLYNQIIGLRHRLVKVYREANEEDKKMWQSLIDKQFGAGYTRKHLEGFKFTDN